MARVETFRYGLSTLHAWIKFLECILHISYKLEYQKTLLRRVKTEQRGNSRNLKLTQNALWKEIGIKVDQVAQGSLVTLIAASSIILRKQQKPQEFMWINVIRRFAVILQTLSSGYLRCKLHNYTSSYTDGTKCHRASTKFEHMVVKR